MRYIHFILFAALLMVSACNDDFDINGEWEDITVVYGLIDASDTAHYIRINKAFIGQGDIYDMAQVHDSIYYTKNIGVYLIEYELVTGGEYNPYIDNNWQRTTTDTIELHYTTEIHKNNTDQEGNPGTFNSTENVLYKTTYPLKNGRRYRLEIHIPGKEKVWSDTYMIDKFALLGSLEKNIYQLNLNREENFVEHVDWYMPVYAKFFQTIINFNYFEYDIINFDTSYHTTQLTYPEMFIGEVRGPADPMINYVTKAEIGGVDFYQRLSTEIPEKSSEIKRVMIDMDFIFLAGGADFYNYLRVSQTQGGYGQDPAGYSNIRNGIGLFDSRFKYEVKGKLMTNPSMDSLSRGRFTKKLNFSNIAEQK